MNDQNDPPAQLLAVSVVLTGFERVDRQGASGQSQPAARASQRPGI
jgi:hypothetical protein